MDRFRNEYFTLPLLFLWRLPEQRNPHQHIPRNDGNGIQWNGNEHGDL